MDFKANSRIKTFLLGPVQMVLSAVGFALMTYFAKIATKEIPSPEVTFFRLALGVLVTLAVVKIRGIKLITENTRLLAVRGFFGGGAVLLFFLAIEWGTVTNSVVLQNTYPIFTLLIAAYYLKEKISIRAVAFMLISFLGIILLIRPDISNIRTADILALVSGILGGFAITAVRNLRMKNESSWTIFFYFCFFGAVISILLALPDWEWPNRLQYIYIFITGVLGLVSQVCMTNAYKYCSAAVGGILSMSTSIFSFIIGLLFLNEHVGALDLTGIILIITGNILVVTFDEEHRKTKPEQI